MQEGQPNISSIMNPKIGFYLGNHRVPDADLRFPEAGNPGIGGSEFGLVALPYFFSLYYHDYELVIYANVTKFLPTQLASIQANDSVDAAHKAIQDNCQIILVRLCDRDVNSDFVQAVSGSDLKVIVWAQNNPSSQQMDLVASCFNISRLVCVGREELDLLRDHVVIYKTTCIFNGIYSPTYTPKHHIVGTGTTVVYLGSLVREKGFHLLARAWPQVKAQVPGVRLKVIGSGKVYDENAELGRWGIADEDYEREFRPFISDEKGYPDGSVAFLGRLGKEKVPILQQADIGVVNPNRNPNVGTETFCWSAVELQACGTPVISAAEDGLLDTVVHGQTGMLTHNDRDLAEYIVRLLGDRELRERYGRNAMEHVRSRFEYKEICHQWQVLFLDVINCQPGRVYPMKPNIFYHHKYLREGLRIAKYYIPRLRTIPSISAMPTIGKRKLRSYIRKSGPLSGIVSAIAGAASLVKMPLLAKSKHDICPRMTQQRCIAQQEVGHNLSLAKQSSAFSGLIKTDLLVFSYDLPADYRSRPNELALPSETFYAISDFFKSIGTTDPRKADFFFVPLNLIQSQFKNEDPGRIINELEYLSDKKDHILVATGDFSQRSKKNHFGRAYEKTYDWMENFVLLALESTSDLILNQDIGIVPFNTLVDCPYFNTNNRVYLYSFLGQTKHELLPEYHVRTQLSYLENKSDVLIGKKLDASTRRRLKRNYRLAVTDDYELLARNSTFCLAPAGYGQWTYRFFHAIQWGAIPVLFADDYIKPFDKSIPYDSFSLTLPEKDILNVDKILRAISLREIREYQDNLKANQSRFTRRAFFELLVSELASLRQ